MYDELVKRLRICPDYNEGCVNCPHEHDLGCRTTTMHEAADAIEELQGKADAYLDAMTYEHNRAARLLWDKEHCWIPVTERLPENRCYVLAYEDGDIMMAWYSGGEWYLSDMYEIIELKPTHWMPLPQPPKEET